MSSEERGAEKSERAKREEDTLEFWRANRIFEKAEAKDAPKGEFIFYDGPPFATGLPHYGHILAGTIKDAIPRYKTMRGFRVRRRWGWDCHGLPLENQIEEELGIKTKKDIEALGIERFNRAARERVMRYADEWKRIIPRMGRWADMEHDYKTMDTPYTESVWWAFKTLFDKKLIYEGFKAMHLCSRCGTTLSNFEVSQGYRDVEDLALTVKFELLDPVGGQDLPEAGGPRTYLLAWTTTPWTLPGNLALAVAPTASYVLVQIGEERFVVARDRLSVLPSVHTVVTEFLGAELLGKRYRPPFSAYFEANLPNKKRAWRVYGAAFVTLAEGTGIVHIAPAFGEDDLALAQTEGLPVVHHVGMDGAIQPEGTELAGLQAKPKEDPTRTDVEVLKLLVQKNLLFKKEKITHSYPHCWRCETPLLNYAASSWFVKVTDFRDKLVAENEKIHWVPADIKEGRFGNWLRGARDWAISRSRFWGAPIPVWRGKDGRLMVMGSVEELRRYAKKSGNRYFLLRHGEAENNAAGIVSSLPETPHHLTKRGREEARRTARALAASIDLIIVSPFVRTRETAAIVAEALRLPPERVRTDARLGEVNTGEFNGRSIQEYREFATRTEKFVRAPKGGETLQVLKERVGELLYELERSERGKRILLVTHEDPAWLMCAAAWGATVPEAVALKDTFADFNATGTLRELRFTPLPHNEKYEIDLHRPYIDEVGLVDEKGEALTRVPDVFDCWFESGSMPFASNHYPFEHTDVFNPTQTLFHRSKGFPADFISESMDQTRGWFYSLLVLSVALFNRTPYRAVVTNGLVLAEDGKKMSKRLKNYPDPVELVDRQGADALRYYLLSSPLMRGEELNFSEKSVDEIGKKLIGRLDNVRAFYALYAPPAGAPGVPPEAESGHVLDRWIRARLSELQREVTAGLEAYELDRAARPFLLFVDDLSTWYLRRSRGRFKSADAHARHEALSTTRFVLRELAALLAPFAPFFAEELFRATREEHDAESVHLSPWPSARKAAPAERELLAAMARARHLVSQALEARARAGIKVRQPLSRLTLKDAAGLSPEHLELIRDEVNVKEVTVDAAVAEEVALATELSEELQDEGAVRELIRFIQELRKGRGLTPATRIEVAIATDDYGAALIKRFEEQLRRAVNASRISSGAHSGETLLLRGHSFVVALTAQ